MALRVSPLPQWCHVCLEWRMGEIHLTFFSTTDWLYVCRNSQPKWRKQHKVFWCSFICDAKQNLWIKLTNVGLSSAHDQTLIKTPYKIRCHFNLLLLSLLSETPLSMSLIFQPVLIRSPVGRPSERSTQINLKRAPEHMLTKTHSQGGKCQDFSTAAATAAASKLKLLDAQCTPAAETHPCW